MPTKQRGRVGRLDRLIGENYRLLAFRELSSEYQLAIAHYMTIDGEAWECHFSEAIAQAQSPVAALRDALNIYAHEYGDTRWGVLELPADTLKAAIMADIELKSDFDSWNAYAAWYCKGAVPNHPVSDRWPVILSSNDEETLQDGWHRCHCYLRRGDLSVPAVFYPEKRHERRASPV